MQLERHMNLLEKERKENEQQVVINNLVNEIEFMKKQKQMDSLLLLGYMGNNNIPLLPKYLKDSIPPNKLVQYHQEFMTLIRDRKEMGLNPLDANYFNNYSGNFQPYMRRSASVGDVSNNFNKTYPFSYFYGICVV